MSWFGAASGEQSPVNERAVVSLAPGYLMTPGSGATKTHVPPQPECTFRGQRGGQLVSDVGM